MTDTTATDISTLRINGERLWTSLMVLAQIGATPKGGLRLTLHPKSDAQMHNLLFNEPYPC